MFTVKVTAEVEYLYDWRHGLKRAVCLRFVGWGFTIFVRVSHGISNFKYSKILKLPRPPNFRRLNLISFQSLNQITIQAYRCFSSVFYSVYSCRFGTPHLGCVFYRKGVWGFWFVCNGEQLAIEKAIESLFDFSVFLVQIQRNAF